MPPKIRLLMRRLFWLLALGVAAAPAAEVPDSVKAVLFHGPECPECDELLAYYVPALIERHGRRLELAGIDMAEPHGSELYRAAAGELSLPPQWAGEPSVIVGRHTFVGLVTIATALGDELDRLASDRQALRWPPIPGLPELLPEAIRDIQSRVTDAESLPELPGNDQESTQTWSNAIANALAVVVLVGMIVALGISMQRVRHRVWTPAINTGWIIVAIVVGLGSSAYTAYVSLADVTPVCGPVGDCAAVQQSEYSRIAGIPMGVLGLVAYSAILVTWLFGRRVSPGGSGWRWLPWAIALVGVLFSLRLTALEPFVIGATCLWCLTSAVAITALLWLLSGETASRPPDESTRVG